MKKLNFRVGALLVAHLSNEISNKMFLTSWAMSPLLLRTSMQFYLHFPIVLSTYHSQISHQKVHQNRPILIYYIEKSQHFPALRPGPPRHPHLLSSFASRMNIIASLRSAISGVFWNIHSHAWCKYSSK